MLKRSPFLILGEWFALQDCYQVRTHSWQHYDNSGRYVLHGMDIFELDMFYEYLLYRRCSSSILRFAVVRSINCLFDRANKSSIVYLTCNKWAKFWRVFRNESAEKLRANYCRQFSELSFFLFFFGAHLHEELFPTFRFDWCALRALICMCWWSSLVSGRVEPVGLKPPTFSSDSEISRFKKKFGYTLALLCQAQAFPVPSFKWVLEWG